MATLLNASWALVDGEAADTVPLGDRGLHFGDGLFESIRVERGQALLWHLHAARLARGCEVLGMEFPADRLLERELAEVCQGAPEVAMVKLLLTRGDGRGYAVPAGGRVRRIWLLYPLRDDPEARAEGVAVRECRLRLSLQPRLAGIKHLNRIEQILARGEVEPPFREGLCFDQRERLVEATSANVFLVRDEMLVTPRLDACGIAGVMRARVMNVARELGMPVSETEVDHAALASADELLLTNSLIGIWPVRQLGTQARVVGPVCRRLQAACGFAP
ncbi:MAG: aminodeoxychorismate lyase [Gammaproteobacteria bacterium]|nr:aminodeoxychorismate lyase [Gammaproteobacteria bacterium]